MTKIIESRGWQGIIKVKIKNLVTGEEKKEILFNRLMNAALDEIIKPLYGEPANLELAYLALGTSNTPVNDTQEQLGNEIFRTQFQSVTRTGTGEVISLAIVLDVEAVGTIEEIGVFAGSEATGDPDTGLMVSRILWHKVKTSTEEIQFSRIDRVVRG